MCGISGWYLKPGELEPEGVLEGMHEALRHRGPDDSGFFRDPTHGIAFAHNRLAILDLSARSHQPMTSADGRHVLSFNGEIYNFREIRHRLEQKGHSFNSTGDTEVVLRAFEEWGPRCVDQLCGMYALAVWSPSEERLFLARDPLGMKPLYWSSLPGDQGFMFASEIKAFLTIPGFSARIDRDSLDQFLTFGYVWHPTKSSLQGVFKIPPGHSMEVHRGISGTLRRDYSIPSLESSGRSDREREEEFFSVLSQVVDEHLVADVPAGLLLSGGLDSSVLAAIASRQKKITTFTMGFADSRIDEREYGGIVARHIGSDHHEIVVTTDDIQRHIEPAIWAIDDLFGDWGTVSTRVLYEKAKEAGLKVVLVGEGSDELLGGYPQFDYAVDARGPLDLRLFELFRRYSGRRYGPGFRWFRRTMRAYVSERGSLFEAVRLFEVECQMPNNYEMKVDRASMSLSIEARAPYLDRRIADIALATPISGLRSNGTNKLLLRSVAERFDLLPEAIHQRPKVGAAIASDWMDQSPEFRQYARSVILDRNGWVDPLGYRDAMTSFFDHGVQGYRFPRAISLFRNLAWRLLLLNLWSRRYLGGEAGHT